MSTKPIVQLIAAVALVTSVFAVQALQGGQNSKRFDVMETTIQDVQDAFKANRLTAHQLVQMYLDRIKAYDQQGPNLHLVITLNPKALEEADRLDAAYKASGPVGPLHGIPVLLKDQVDAAGMPTTLGSVLLKDYMPPNDAFVTAKLKKAGAIILAKMALGEYGGGDTYGSLFGESRNPYDLMRTVGGSSGGTGGGLAANFGTVGIGQEFAASTRRPASFNSVVGMRPSTGLVSRTGVWDGWPSIRGSLTPMARTVTDLAKLLDVLVGYDPEDPVTAMGVGQTPKTYTAFLDRNALKGARLGVLRDTNPSAFDQNAPDYKSVAALFETDLKELKTAGATLVDPIEIPNLKKLMANDRSGGVVDSPPNATVYFSRNPSSPFKKLEDLTHAPGYKGSADPTAAGAPGSDFSAREELMMNMLKVMADNNLDAIVYKSFEQGPPLLRQPSKGIPRINTYLMFIPAIAVPGGFTSEGLPSGMTFLGRPYNESTMIKLAYAYEQATHHRRPPSTTPPLAARN